MADLIRSRPQDIALYNSSELAALAGVSKATVSRLFRRLGFSGSQEVRESLRAQRTAGVPVDLDPGQAMDERLAAQLRQDLENLGRLYASLDPRAVTEVASRIATARRVLVLGFRSGFLSRCNCAPSSRRCATACTSRPSRASRWARSWKVSRLAMWCCWSACSAVRRASPGSCRRWRSPRRPA
ncbi:hypothetical protein GCM10025866_15670 [Naasia aerilata]|uniref:HTH rpiR-type domain-containing protein n=1 Tax=Naasia aerilata TaxID=1162966 RepID=A0ABM8GBR4_9MICO|nr:hypothetical protein GCM10025866_15670 [Naasia aerilata]